MRDKSKVTTKDVKNDAIKRMILNAVIFLGLMFVTFWFIFKDQDFNDIIKILGQVNPGFIIIGLLCMVGYFSMEAWNINSLLKSFGEKINFFKALKFTLIGFFFCAVTPGASGGQPLEIYYMTKEKISAGNATIAILIQTCGIQFAVTLLGIICAIIGHGMLGGAVLWLFIIGLIINGVAFLILALCIFFPNWLRKVIRKIMGFVYKIGFTHAKEWQKSIEKG